MNIKTFCCADCAFYQSAIIPDYTKDHVPGAGRPRIRGFVCGIRPPVAAAARPIVTGESQLCALWTSATGEQPLRHLLDFGKSYNEHEEGADNGL